MAEEKNNGQKLEASFLQFLYGMAAQTQIQLGLMEHPLTNKKEPDPVQAKYSIDLLGIFAEKTKGNLSAEEDEYLKNILKQLQVCYVDLIEKK